MTITARPAEPLRGRAEWEAFVSGPTRAGGYVRSLADLGLMARDGTITISGTNEEIFGRLLPGALTLTIHVERPGRGAGEPGGSVVLREALSWEGLPADSK